LQPARKERNRPFPATGLQRAAAQAGFGGSVARDRDQLGDFIDHEIRVAGA
jgi:hypothetical protein